MTTVHMDSQQEDTVNTIAALTITVAVSKRCGVRSIHAILTAHARVALARSQEVVEKSAMMVADTNASTTDYAILPEMKRILHHLDL